MSARCNADPAAVHARIADLMESVGCDAGSVAMVLTGGCREGEAGRILSAIDRAAVGVPMHGVARAAVTTLRLIVGAAMAGEADRAADGLDVWARTHCAACARIATMGIAGRCSYCQGQQMDREALRAALVCSMCNRTGRTVSGAPCLCTGATP